MIKQTLSIPKDIVLTSLYISLSNLFVNLTRRPSRHRSIMMKNCVMSDLSPRNEKDIINGKVVMISKIPAADLRNLKGYF